MNWFRQESLIEGFSKFLFTGTDADRQIDFLLDNVNTNMPFFGFINFGETHAPYTYKGKIETCKEDVRARRMRWPPVQQGIVGIKNYAFKCQSEAVEFLDSRISRLFNLLPKNTIVILTSDHGDCFGEDGYWGHGINHPKIFEVPLSIFRLDHQPLEE